jgi:hypothetical protein
MVMNPTQPLVVPIFATPFGIASLPDSVVLNPVLAALLAERAGRDGVDPAGGPAYQYSGRDDLFEWPDEPVQRLKSGIINSVVAVVRSINDFSDAQLASFRIQTRCWYTIVRTDGCVPSTSYPNAAWCAVYCVAAPPPSAMRFDSGVLRLHESFRATMFSDATTTLTHMPYQPGHNTWRPVPGQVAVFPASITHEVAMVRSEGELVLVSALVRFVAPGQTGMPWW